MQKPLFLEGPQSRAKKLIREFDQALAGLMPGEVVDGVRMRTVFTIAFHVLHLLCAGKWHLHWPSHLVLRCRLQSRAFFGTLKECNLVLAGAKYLGVQVAAAIGWQSRTEIGAHSGI
jgi:hypothetical protein